MKKFAIVVSLLVLTLCLPLLSLGQTGCSAPTNAQIAADGAAVGQAVLAIAAIETDPTLKQNLTTAANDLVKVTANWKTGTSADDINTAAIALEVVLGSIPQTANYVQLIPIAVAAIDVLLANLPATEGKVMTMKASYNPYRHGAVIKHRFGRSAVGDFKAAWNEKATGTLVLK